MRQPLIQIKGLSKSFIDNDIFRGIDLSVDKSQSLAIIGGSGQGKSVLLKCIVAQTLIINYFSQVRTFRKRFSIFIGEIFF